MWRFGVILLLGCISIENVSASPVNRDKRSPYCPSDYPPPPPPPPPPVWPPPPPYWPPPPQPPPPPPPSYWEREPHHHHHESAAYSQAESVASNQESANYQNLVSNQDYANQPCDTCKGQSSAVSNANSDIGNAVAIAIARARANKK